MKLIAASILGGFALVAISVVLHGYITRPDTRPSWYYLLGPHGLVRADQRGNVQSFERGWWVTKRETNLIFPEDYPEGIPWALEGAAKSP